MSEDGLNRTSDFDMTSETIFDQNTIDPVWLPHYGAAEQLSRLRDQPPPRSSPSRQAFHPQHVMFETDSSPLETSVASNLFESNTGATPSSTSMENVESFLDIDPMMCSLLWKTLEASITEASGSSYLGNLNRHPGDGVLIHGSSTPHLDNPFSIQAVMDDGVQTQEVVGDPTRRHSVFASGMATTEQTHEPGSTSALGPEAAQMVEQMKSDLHSVMKHIEAPIEPEKGLASSCFWLCRRHYLPASVLTAPQKHSKISDDGYALVMNLIAIGSLWHQKEVARKWGSDIWSFTLRVVWSRGMRNMQDDSTLSMLMAILLSGHSYVLMSSDPAVHRLGRRAWLFCHLLHDSNRPGRGSGRDDGNSETDDNLDFRLRNADYRAKLRSNASLLHHTWQRWRGYEGGIRVAWGICLYDSQQAAWLLTTPSLQSDVNRRYPEPACESIFDAKTALQWLERYEKNPPKRRDLDVLMQLLHRPYPCSAEKIEWSSSQQAHYNILECIYSSWQLDKATLGKTSEYWNMAARKNSPDLGLLRCAHALANWWHFWGAAQRTNRQEDIYCLLIRWHCIHLNLGLNEVDIVQYIRERTEHLSVGQEASEAALQVPVKASSMSVEEFYRSSRGRRTLWHAAKISAELTKLPRSTSTPLHVAQAAYESTIVLVAFALVAKTRHDTRQGRPLELLDGGDDADDWVRIGLAGFLNQDSQMYIGDDSAQNDWGNLTDSSVRRWILEGETKDTLISGLPLYQCVVALQDIVRSLEQSRFLWCLATDYQRLIHRTISLL
jgi:hypothetical protein